MQRNNQLERILHGLHQFELAILAIILLSMVLIATVQILLRNFFDMGLIWADPLLRAMLLWLGLLGAIVASHDNKHISIDLLSRFVTERWQCWIRMCTSFFTAIVCVVVAFHSGRFVLDEYSYQTPSNIASSVPSWIVEIIIPLAFTMIALRYFLLIGRYWLHKPVGKTSV
ncbi:MAG: TRAP transporter small permease subunit [Gammaproteobacteria bacterium]|nr:TRAP transporter small permease subunit [Gammaproteobacteria bacterium]